MADDAPASGAVIPPADCRLAGREDGPAIKAVVYAVLREYGLSPDPAGTDADLDDVVSTYLERGGVFYVVESEPGRIVGCGGLYPHDDGSDCEIRKMYLLAEARGRGLGTALLERLIDFATQAGFSRIIVETASVLTEAIALYKKRGFVRFTYDRLAKRCDQAYLLELGGRPKQG